MTDSALGRRCFRIMFLAIVSGKANAGLPDCTYACTDSSEGSSETTSLLQLSVEHAPSTFVGPPDVRDLGQRQAFQDEVPPDDSEEKKLEQDWADLLARSWAYGEKHFHNLNDNLGKALSKEVPSLQAFANALPTGASARLINMTSVPDSASVRGPRDAGESHFSRLMQPQSGYAALPSLSMDDVPARTPGDTDLYMFSATATNVVTFLLVLFVIGCIIYKPGYRGESVRNGGCPTWVMLTLVVSYVSWLFGFFMYNTSYFMTGLFMGKEIIMSRDFQTGQAAVFKESPHLIIVNLIQAKDCIDQYCAASRFAGWFYLLLSVGDPLVKLTLMIVGEVFRRRPQKVIIARKCIIACQVLSKWASPMYYFLLIAHCQFLLMDKPPGLSTRAVLDVGWVGFTLFCVTNVVSAVSIPLPPLRSAERQPPSSGLSERSKISIMIFVSLAAGLYFFLIVFGCSYDLVTLNTESYEQFMKGFLDPRTEKAFHTSTSIVGCMNVLLYRFFTSGQLIPLVAFFIIAGLVIAMALADMCLLTFAAFYIYKGNKELFQYWIALSRITRQCSAVDVLVVGVFLANLSKSLVIEFGVYFLLYAEILRYTVVYLIMENAAQYIEDPSNYIDGSHFRDTSHITLGLKMEEPRDYRKRDGNDGMGKGRGGGSAPLKGLDDSRITRLDAGVEEGEPVDSGLPSSLGELADMEEDESPRTPGQPSNLGELLGLYEQNEVIARQEVAQHANSLEFPDTESECSVNSAMSHMLSTRTTQSSHSYTKGQVDETGPRKFAEEICWEAEVPGTREILQEIGDPELRAAPPA